MGRIKCSRRGAYTFRVIIVQTVVSHHLYQNDQFCGFSGSSGPSHLTRFGSALGLGRKGSGVGVGWCFLGCGGSEYCGSSLALYEASPKRDSSSRAASNFITSSPSSCTIVDVEACTTD